MSRRFGFWTNQKPENRHVLALMRVNQLTVFVRARIFKSVRKMVYTIEGRGRQFAEHVNESGEQHPILRREHIV